MAKAAKANDPLAELVSVSGNVSNAPMQGVVPLSSEAAAAPAAAIISDAQRIIPNIAPEVGLTVTQSGNMSNAGTHIPPTPLVAARESPQAPIPGHNATAALPSVQAGPIVPPPFPQVAQQQVPQMADEHDEFVDDDEVFDPMAVDDFDASFFEGPTPIANPSPSMSAPPPIPEAVPATPVIPTSTDPNAPPFDVDTPAPVPPPPPGQPVAETAAANGEPAKRKRRTKAEMEAARQAAANPQAAQVPVAAPVPVSSGAQIPPPPPPPPGMPVIPQQMPQPSIPQPTPVITSPQQVYANNAPLIQSTTQTASVVNGWQVTSTVANINPQPVGSINPFNLPPHPGANAPEPNDPDTQFSRALTAYCDQMVRQIYIQLGIALLWDQSAREAGNTIHDAIFAMRWNSGAMDQMSPAQLNQIARALSAHQVACTGVENFWEARYQSLAKERDAMLFRKRENYPGGTKQEKEVACISADPQMRELHASFTVAQYIALATRNIGERFVQLENGIKRTIENALLEMRNGQR